MRTCMRSITSTCTDRPIRLATHTHIRIVMRRLSTHIRTYPTPITGTAISRVHQGQSQQQLGRPQMTRRAHIFATTALVIVAFSAQGQNNARLIPTMQELEGQIADLKSQTASLVSSDIARLNALPPKERLLAPPVVWRVPGAPTEFKDCVDCPQMVVVPAGEYTMGSPPSE